MGPVLYEGIQAKPRLVLRSHMVIILFGTEVCPGKKERDLTLSNSQRMSKVSTLTSSVGGEI